MTESNGPPFQSGWLLFFGVSSSGVLVRRTSPAQLSLAEEFRATRGESQQFSGSQEENFYRTLGTTDEGGLFAVGTELRQCFNTRETKVIDSIDST